MATKISAFSKVKDLISNTRLTDTQLSYLQNRTFTVKNTSIIYPLLKEVNMDTLTNEDITINNKVRYNKKPLFINGKTYLMTNNIYEKNIPRVAALLSEFEKVNQSTFDTPVVDS